LSPRLIAIVFATVLATGVGGWLYGASGRSDLETARREAVQRADLNEARALAYAGLVALLQLNFGDAAQHFESARAPVERTQAALREVGQAEQAGRLAVVLSHLRDAQRRAAGLDPSASKSAEAALLALDPSKD
jgi:hypothetical protein